MPLFIYPDTLLINTPSQAIKVGIMLIYIIIMVNLEFEACC